MFVRPHHKERFKQMCDDLTGAVCGEGEKRSQPEVQGEGNPLGVESWCAGGGSSHIQGGE